VRNVLVLGIGNPSRGDDALGHAFVERLAEALPAGVEVLTDFQLQIEHAMDLAGRTHVVFVDASLAEGVTFERIAPRADAAAQTHALAPEAVLEVHRQVIGPPPAAWVLGIGGASFELGDGLGATARANLEAALALFASALESSTLAP
jgi:hydrogenase maturation protease